MLTAPSVYWNIQLALLKPLPETSTTTGNSPVSWLPRVTVKVVAVAPVTVAATPPTVTSLSVGVVEKPLPLIVTLSPDTPTRKQRIKM